MARLGDVIKIKPSTVSLKGERIWLLNLDMVEQQTGRVFEHNFVNVEGLDGSIVQFDEDAVLYSKLRPNLNKVVLPDMAGFATSEMLPLMPDTAVLTREYLAYFLRSDSFVTWAVSKTAGAKMPRLGSKELLSKEIPLPTLGEQFSIAQQFVYVDTLISLRKQQLAKLDELVKSRFVEMFGHQSHNEKSLPYLTIDDVAEIYLGITHTPTYVDSGVMFISAKNTSGDFLDLSDVKYISREEFEGAPKGSKPQVNDVLFSRVGSNLGHPVILEEDLELCTFVSLGFLRTKGKVTSNYLKHWMRDEFFATQVSAHVKGGGQPNLNTGWLKEFKIIVPSIEAQKEFDEFCKQVDKSKLSVQQSIDQLETLKKSLMQKYFG